MDSDTSIYVYTVADSSCIVYRNGALRFADGDKFTVRNADAKRSAAAGAPGERGSVASGGEHPMKEE